MPSNWETMSRFAIVLCAVLFASTVSSTVVSGAVNNVKSSSEQAITIAISKFKEKSEATQEKAERATEKILDKVHQLGERIYDEIRNVLLQSEDEIDVLASKAKGIDISECTESTANLDRTALAIISNMTACITDKLATGSEYIESIIKVSADGLTNLIKIREEAHHCSDNVEGLKSAAAAMVCTNVAAGKATWIIPEMTVEVTRLNILLASLAPSLAYCKATNGLVTFQHEASKIVEKTKQCIQQKIDGVHNITTPGIDDA